MKVVPNFGLQALKAAFAIGHGKSTLAALKGPIWTLSVTKTAPGMRGQQIKMPHVACPIASKVCCWAG